jgi:DNA (cytosine-5)-methyltransferase 1
MSRRFKVVDIFAGPGGLAEGFAAARVDGRSVFDIALSVEKEASAFRTLRLRAFTRQFRAGLPEEYYSYIGGKLSRDSLITRYPAEWAAACSETKQLELGLPGTAGELDPILRRISEEASGESVLVGGPPCQAYSLVGRARNRGIPDYDAATDHRHFLYREYIRILGLLRPAVFVMENVKGFLSSRVEGNRIFTKVLSDLRSAGGPDSYRIIPLTAERGRDGTEYLIRAEKYGVPQARHRVILLGVRADLASEKDWVANHQLEPSPTATLADVLSTMPPLRSGLSKSSDGPDEWRHAIATAFRKAAQAAFGEEDEILDSVAARLCSAADEIEGAGQAPTRSSTIPASVTNKKLADWLLDPRLRALPNHESRGHMEADLSRYAFAIAFAEIANRSPKAAEFPRELAPDHDNWDTGKFADRFRVQLWNAPSSTVTSHISKDGHYFIHPDLLQCRSLTVREAARLQTFPDNYFFEGNRTQQYVQVGNAVPPLLARQIAAVAYHYVGRESSDEDQNTRSMARTCAA